MQKMISSGLPQVVSQGLATPWRSRQKVFLRLASNTERAPLDFPSRGEVKKRAGNANRQ